MIFFLSFFAFEVRQSHAYASLLSYLQGLADVEAKVSSDSGETALVA